MSQFQIVAMAALLGPSYIASVFLIGSALGGRFVSDLSSRWERCGLILLTGLLAHAALTSLLLWLAPAWSGAALWLLAAASLLGVRSQLAEIKALAKPMLLLCLYAFACYILLIAYHYGPARGPTLFWSIYSLTNVTPGDSPQAAFQAQYLLHAGRLVGGQDFALFDRPFLAGILTAGALPSFGLNFNDKFYDYPELLAFSYANLWMAINAICILPLLNLIERFTKERTTRVVAVLLLASPFLVYSIIGLWPKLLAVALLCCAGTQALRGNWKMAILLSGASFFAHGSFLWAHISLCGVLVLSTLAVGLQRASVPWSRLSGMLLACVAVPAAWFVAEHISGGATPLRAYYLYNVDVAYGLHHTADEVARSFYSSTSMANISALPWMNMLKAVLPAEALDLVLRYGVASGSISWRQIGESLFFQQFMRIWFALGLVGGIVTWRGVFHKESAQWVPRLALIAFFILPLIPGLGLYRRDDHFILPTMMFSIIPVLIAFCISVQSLAQRTASLLALGILSEYSMVYFWRYPPGRYVGEFHAYYLAFVAVVLLCAAITLLWPHHRKGDLRQRVEQRETDQ